MCDRPTEHATEEKWREIMRAGIPFEVLRKDRPAMLNRRSRPGFTMLELVVVLVIIFVLIALLLPARRSAREPARRTQCKNNLKQIGLALHNYHDRYGSFPPAFTVDTEGKPLHSWRTLILPFLDQEPIYNQIDLSKPWDDPANAFASATRLPAYSCRSAMLKEPHLTTYLGVVGEAAFFHPTVTRKMADFGRLGTSEKIAVLDVDAEHAVPWMSPMDSTPKYLLTFGPKSKQSHSHGLQVLHVDGTVQFLSEDLPMEGRQKMLVMPSESTREK
jgi:type II secretory pathway pseudopilin PulG